MMRSLVAVSLAALAAGAEPAPDSRLAQAPSAGTKVASARHFDIFVTKVDEHPLRAAAPAKR